MRTLHSYASIVPQEPGIIGAYKQVEKVGRACWASEHLITEDSYEKFVEGLIRREHNAPLEHATLYLVIAVGSPMYDEDYVKSFSDATFFQKNPYSKVNKKTYDVAKQANHEWLYEFIAENGPTQVYYITTNLRVIVENFEDYEKILDYSVNNPYPEHEKRITVHFTCQRAISAEFNRHRKDSMMERSSRYCNFSKDKFGNEIGVVVPDWVDSDHIPTYSFGEYVSDLADTSNWSKLDYWLFANLACEWAYMNLIDMGAKPEEARDILPMDLQTELYHTAFVSDWEHFFKLRAWISAGNKPHPEAMKLARQVFDEFVKLGLVSEQLRIDNEIKD